MTALRGAAIADIGFGAVCAICVAVLMSDASDLNDRARLFPIAVLWCLLIAALIILGGGLRQFLRDDDDGGTAAEGSVIAAIAPALLVIVGGVMLVWFGFYLTSPVFIFAMHTLHTRLSTGVPPTGRMLMTGAALAVIATAAMYVIFDILIGLPAPVGAFF